MNARHELPLQDPASATVRLAELIASRAALAIESGRDPALAFSSRIAVFALGAALAQAFDLDGDLRGRLHLFPSDLCISGPCGRREELRALLSRLRLPSPQLHVPPEGGDLYRTARVYESDIRTHFRLGAGEAPAFDLLCLAPADLGAPRHAEASDRLATGVFHVETGERSVSLSVASLMGARAVATFGPDRDAQARHRLPGALVARAFRLHWMDASAPVELSVSE